MAQCTFYKWGKGHIFGASACIINDERVSPKEIRHYCNGICDNYHNCLHYKNLMCENNIFEAILNSISIDDKEKDEILKKISEFRKEKLEKNELYKDLLVYHDRMSKIIVDAIKNTRIETIDEFLVVIYEDYILKVYEFITNKDSKTVILKYEEMFKFLIKYFSLNNELDRVEEQYKHPERYGRYALVKK